MLAASSATRLVTRHSVSLTFNLPVAYESRIQSVPGVKQVAKTIWFGGSLPAKKEGQADGRRRQHHHRLEQVLQQHGGGRRQVLPHVPGDW
jgi:hypothetical protein